MPADEFRQMSLQFGRSGAVKAGPLPQHGDDCISDIGIVVSQQVRSKGCMIVDVLISICIPDVCTLTFDEDDFGLNGSVH